MATVKLSSGGAIILKNGKVSCACCAAGACCMYPADRLEVSYTEYDLLETVSLTYDFAVGLVLTKNGSTYGPESVGSYEYRITHDPAGWQIEVKESGGGWTILDSGIECLITGDGNLTPGDDSVEDQFAATYTANVDPTFADAYTETITRISLCVWQGATVTLTMADIIWSYDVTDLGGENKTTDQNTPIGSYEIPAALSSFSISA